MSPESYNERLKDSKDPAGLRLKMVLLRRTGPPLSGAPGQCQPDRPHVRLSPQDRPSLGGTFSGPGATRPHRSARQAQESTQ